MKKIALIKFFSSILTTYIIIINISKLEKFFTMRQTTLMYFTYLVSHLSLLGWPGLPQIFNALLSISSHSFNFTVNQLKKLIMNLRLDLSKYWWHMLSTSTRDEKIIHVNGTFPPLMIFDQHRGTINSLSKVELFSEYYFRQLLTTDS